MLQSYFRFLDANPIACWIGMAVCILAVGAIEAGTFPL